MAETSAPASVEEVFATDARAREVARALVPRFAA